VPECVCNLKNSFDLNSFVAKLRIETGGRGGKLVTVIDELPASIPFLKDLAKRLKSKCGTGGTYREGPKGGVVEIQGDKREYLRKLLSGEGIKFKG